MLLSVAPGAFSGDGQTQTALFRFQFDGTPELRETVGGLTVSLDREQTWLEQGDPVVPVRESSILLPQGMSIRSVEVAYLDSGVVLGTGTQLLAAPAAVPFDDPAAVTDVWTETLASSFPDADAVTFSNHQIAGYNVGSLRVFPVEYDAATGTLIYHSEVAVEVTVAGGDAEQVRVRGLDADIARVAGLVDNPEALADYTVAPTGDGGGYSALLPEGEAYEYVVVTSAALAGSFQPLIDQKIAAGLTAGIVTTEYIYANYEGTETGDNADRVREFLRDAYTNWNTEWVLLGGDIEVIPHRGVYASVGSTVQNALPTDMYYACLDGPWNSDGDGIWGESDDGAHRGDIDLAPDVYIGRAPVSDPTEAANFVNKTVRYLTQGHSHPTDAVWLGEKLDGDTWASYSGIPIAQQTIPDDWNLVERYDSVAAWSGSQFLADLNASPHIINHLGHTSQTYNARLYSSTVAGLTNTDPYFMYSQGCNSGSFDTHNISIAEQHVVAEHGAFGVVMNSRYGWYMPGSIPGANHYYALEFWDAVFNEGLVTLGQANQDSKDDNLFRVSSTGVYRWIHFETNLFGDPQAAFQLDGAPPAPPPSPTGIEGVVFDDGDGDGLRDAGENGLAGELVFLDLDGNGQFSGTFVESTSAPLDIPDADTLVTTLTVAGGPTSIYDLDVRIDVAHSYVADLVAYVVSPSGTQVELFSSVGGSGDNFAGTVLDDEAATPIAGATAPFTGQFRPSSPLALFDGENANGTWQLVIQDTASWDTGTLEGWSLDFYSSAAEPYVYTDSDGAFAFNDLAPGSYDVGHQASAGWSHTAPSDGIATAEVPEGAVVDVQFGAIADLPIEPVDLGVVDFWQSAGLDLSQGGLWYQVQTARDGWLTIEALFAGSTDNVELTLYDGQQRQMVTSLPSSGGERVSWEALAGETYLFSVSGTLQDVDLRLANLVDHEGESVSVCGTDGADRFEFAVTAGWYTIKINGVEYSFSADQVSSITFAGGRGEDTAVLTGSAGSEELIAYPGSATFAGEGYTVGVASTPEIIARGGGGVDVAHLRDSAGDDTFEGYPDYGKLTGAGYASRAEGFRYLHAYGLSGGNDVALLYDSAADDTFVGRPDYGFLYNESFFNRAKGFDIVLAYSLAGGVDTARLYDSAGADTLVTRPTSAHLTGNGYFNRVFYFAQVDAFAGGGTDVARMYDGPWNDTFTGAPAESAISGEAIRGGVRYPYQARALNFEQVAAYAWEGGANEAHLHDSSGDDSFTASPTHATLAGSSYELMAWGFATVYGYADGGGLDVAEIDDSPGDDLFIATPAYATLSGPGFARRVEGFDYVHAYGRAGGTDVAHLYDSPGDDRYFSTPDYTFLTGDGFFNRAKFFDFVHGYAFGGNDTAWLYDSAGDDLVVGRKDFTFVSGPGFFTRAKFFDQVYAVGGNGGNDQVQLRAEGTVNHLTAAGRLATLSYGGNATAAYNFSRVQATATESNNATSRVETVDFLLEMLGVWSEV